MLLEFVSFSQRLSRTKLNRKQKLHRLVLKIMNSLKKLHAHVTHDTHFYELLRKGSTAFALRTSGIILSFILTLMITHQYGAVDYGNFMLTLVIIQILSTLLRLGLDNIIIRDTAAAIQANNLALAKGTAMTAQRTVLIISLITSICLYYTSPIIGTKVLNKPDMILPLTMGSLYLTPITMCYLIAQSLKGVKRIAMSSFIYSISFPLLTLLLLIGLETFVEKSLYMLLTHYSLAIWITWWIAERHWQHLVRQTKAIKPKLRQLLNSSIPLLLASAGTMLMTWSDMIILGIYETSEHIGHYNVASKVALLTSVLLAATNAIAAPKFSELYSSGQLHALKRLVKKTTRLMIILMIIPTLILYTFPHEILSTFGSGFERAAPILTLLTLGQFVNVSCGSVVFLLSMTGHEKKVRTIMLTTALINIILNYLLIQSHGVTGVAMATMASLMIWNIWMLFQVKKSLGFWMI